MMSMFQRSTRSSEGQGTNKPVSNLNGPRGETIIRDGIISEIETWCDGYLGRVFAMI